MFDEKVFARVTAWVGRPHVNCFELVRDVYRLGGVELPSSPEEAQRHFRRVYQHDGSTCAFIPEPGDVVRIKNDPVLVNHVGVVIPTRRDFIHSMEEFGVTIADWHRLPWRHRVQSFERYVA